MLRARQSTTARTVGDAAVTLVFAAAIALPMGARFLDPGADTSVIPENRNPAPAPKAPVDLDRLLAFPPRFEAWLDDRFAFRRQLVRWHNAVKILGFHVAPTERAVMGPDLWVYTSANLTFEAYRGTFKLSDSELENWRRVLEARRDWLASRGIEYVFAFAPAKPTIYPEHLPPGYVRGEQTTLEQLQAYMREHSDFRILDLHAPLLAAKAGDREGDWLYYKLGTHWTDRGGFVATQAILSVLQEAHPELAIPREEDYRRVVAADEGDSWAGRLHLEDVLVQHRIALVPKNGWRAIATGEDGNGLGTCVAPDGEGPRLLVFHDSFGSGMWLFLADQFSESHSRAGFQIDPGAVLTLKPDVVVQVMAERRLAAYRPVEALSGSGAAARSAFEAAPHLLAVLDDVESMSALESWSKALLTPAETAGEPPLEVRCRNAGQGFLLPQIELPPGTIPVVRIQLASNVATDLSVLFQTIGRDEYLSSRAVTVPIRKGNNEVFVQVPAEDLAGRLLVLPGRKRGRYQLRSIEIRAR